MPVIKSVAPAVQPVFDEPLSATKVNQFLDCPHSFYLQYILKLPQRTTSPLIEGQAMHKVMEIHNKEKVKDGKPWEEDRFRTAWDDTWQTRRKDVEEYADGDSPDIVWGRGRAFVKDYSRELARDITPQTADTVEQELFSESEGRTRIVSHIDLVTDHPRVMDYKVTKNTSKYKAETSIQLGLYSWITGIRKVGYIFFKKLKTPKVEVVVAERSEISVKRVLNVVNAVAESIKKGNFPYCSPDHWKCQQAYCSVWSFCKQGGGDK